MKLSNIVNKVCCVGLLTAAMPSGFEHVQSVDFGAAKYEKSISGEILRLNQADAKAYCTRLGKRLPTILEFIKFALQHGANAINEAAYKSDLKVALESPDSFLNDDWQKDTPNKIFEIRSFAMRSPAIVWLDRSPYRAPNGISLTETMWSSDTFDQVLYGTETVTYREYKHFGFNLMTGQVNSLSWREIVRPFICL